VQHHAKTARLDCKARTSTFGRGLKSKHNRITCSGAQPGTVLASASNGMKGGTISLSLYVLLRLVCGVSVIVTASAQRVTRTTISTQSIAFGAAADHHAAGAPRLAML
jgi:hypothetical protein